MLHRWKSQAHRAKSRLGFAALILLVSCAGQEQPSEVETAQPGVGASGAEASRRLRENARSDPPVDARDQRALGMNYFLGQGLEPDHVQALVWFRRAAAQGEDVAQMILGVMHQNGQEVPRNSVRAHMWFSLSAEQGNPGARQRLGQLEKRMKPEEIVEARELAHEWKPSSWTGPRPAG